MKILSLVESKELINIVFICTVQTKLQQTYVQYLWTSNVLPNENCGIKSDSDSGERIVLIWSNNLDVLADWSNSRGQCQRLPAFYSRTLSLLSNPIHCASHMDTDKPRITEVNLYMYFRILFFFSNKKYRHSRYMYKLPISKNP